MDNGEVILMCTCHDGKSENTALAERPVVTFSRDRGDTWSEFQLIENTGPTRPKMLTDLGTGNLMFHATGFPRPYRQFFSQDYGRTWTEQRLIQPASNGETFDVEGNALVERDRQGRATRIAEIGWNFDRGTQWPVDPARCFLRWSYDGGRTWKDEQSPTGWRWHAEDGGKRYPRCASEGSLIRAANGWLVAMLRIGMLPRYFHLRSDNMEGMGSSVSRDDGVTWSPVKPIYEAGRMHGHLLCRPNGDLIVTHILRQELHDGRLLSYRRGCEALVSRDHGLTWDAGRQYVLDDFEFFDGVANMQAIVGHLASTQLDDGSILTCYGKYPTNGACLIRWRPEA